MQTVAKNKLLRTQQQRKGTQTGMMLVEVMVSILIFSVGILGLVGLQTVATQNAASAEYRTIAATLANDMVAQMWIKKTANPTSSNISGDITTWKTKVTNSTLPNANASVTRTNGVTTVTVTWKPPSKKSTDTNQYVTQVSIPD
jgi:type IV pilus assembly protein PilV